MSGLSSDQFRDFQNPDVYFDHIPPSDSIIVVCLGAAIWDILVYIPDDFRVISTNDGFSFVIFCFVISRITAVAYVALIYFGRMFEINRHYVFNMASAGLIAVSAVSTSYLFVRRVQAVFVNHKWVPKIFFILWLLLSTVSCMGPGVGIQPSNVSGAYHLKDSHVMIYVVALPWAFFLFDTAVFIAISYKIAKGHRFTMSDAEENGTSWIGFLSGRGLSQLSKAVLRGGQQYYFITVAITLLSGMGFLYPNNARVLTDALSVTVVLAASMASRVFRNLKLLELDPQILSLPTIS